MGRRYRNLLDDTVWEFGRIGYWLIHLVSVILVFFLGMRYAVRRAAIPFALYRMLRSLLRH